VNRKVAVQVFAAVAALFFIGPGLWAFFGPEGFYDELATFEPYNEHFIHDIGAFQIGIGVAFAVALWRRNDALLAAFAGGAVGGAFHTVAHFMDHDLGGKDSDVFVFGVMTVVMAAGAWLRLEKKKGLFGFLRSTPCLSSSRAGERDNRKS
jgi:hypothetical protein